MQQSFEELLATHEELVEACAGGAVGWLAGAAAGCAGRARVRRGDGTAGLLATNPAVPCCCALGPAENLEQGRRPKDVAALRERVAAAAAAAAASRLANMRCSNEGRARVLAKEGHTVQAGDLMCTGWAYAFSLALDQVRPALRCAASCGDGLCACTPAAWAPHPASSHPPPPPLVPAAGGGGRRRVAPGPEARLAWQLAGHVAADAPAAVRRRWQESTCWRPGRRCFHASPLAPLLDASRPPPLRPKPCLFFAILIVPTPQTSLTPHLASFTALLYSRPPCFSPFNLLCKVGPHHTPQANMC